MKGYFLLCVFSFSMLLAFDANAEVVSTDCKGRIKALCLDGQYVPVETDVVVSGPGWKKQWSVAPWNPGKVTYSSTNGTRTWNSVIVTEEGANLSCVQTLVEEEGAASVTVKLTALTDIPCEGATMFIRLPLASYAGGTCELSEDGVKTASCVLPVELATNQPRFFRGECTEVLFSEPVGNRKTRVRTEDSVDWTLQDERAWKGDAYGLFTRFGNGPVLKNGEPHIFRFRLSVEGEADHSPVRLSVDARQPLYQFDGFGGNFVYAIDSANTRYNRDTLRIAWARTQMNLAEWEPVNDDQLLTNVNWAVFTERDKDGSRLREEFQLASEFTKSGTPFVISIWHLPEWMYSDPGRDSETHGRKVAADKWDELAESIGAYLLYARDRYGAEPALFSFNECRDGVFVLLTAEEHRDAIKRIGGHLKSLGLKTQMLLADNGSAAGTDDYAAPAVADPEALAYVGAVAVHSWGGATPAQYRAWGDLADRIKKPLLITEVGVDAAAWQTPWIMNDYSYALREVAMYQDLLLYARPRGLMQWEYTRDYALSEEVATSEGARIVPTPRYHFIRQFSSLTGTGAVAVASHSSNPDRVLFTAFKWQKQDGSEGWAFHIANIGASRTARLVGVPRSISKLRMVVSGEKEALVDKQALRPRLERVNLDLPAQSFVTLTTE